MKYQYEFKHENWGDDWQPYESQWSPNFLEEVAHDIAQENYNYEPMDPYQFEFVVEVRLPGSELPKKFRVSAEADVNFYTREIE